MMQRLRNPLRTIPIELSVLVGVLIFWLALSSFLRWYGFSNSGTEENYAYLTDSSIDFLLLMLPLLIISPIVRFLRIQQVKFFQFQIQYTTVRLFVYIYLFWIFGISITQLATSTFLSTNVNYTAIASLNYLSLDVWLKIPQLLTVLIELSERYPMLYWLIETAYDHTVAAVIVAIFVIAIFSAQLAREYSITILVGVFISMPFWVLLPAVAPYQLSITDSFSSSKYSEEIHLETEPIRALQSQYRHTDWNKKSHEWSMAWEYVHQEGFGYPVSSNPSMHVMWGILMATYLLKAHRWLGYLAFPFILFDVIGTVFFLQHYVVDILTGAIGAIIVIRITKGMIRYEKNRLNVVEDTWFAPLFWIQRLGRTLGSVFIKPDPHL